MSIPQLLDRYIGGPALLRQAIDGMTPDQLLLRPVPGKWSTLEVIAHLADFEIVGIDRLTAVIADEKPLLPGRDEQKYEKRLAYHQRNPEEQLQLIELGRRHMARILLTLTDADWQRTGQHTEAGPLTLEHLLERVTRHIEHHVAFIHEKRRALGL